MADDRAHDDTVLTMCDVLEEEKELEEDANAVLGDSDDTNCTYNDGYVPRQALYACATCTTNDEEPGGVCLACSYECHENHELIELYTKRNFRCDCGNKAFPNNRCHLYAKKDPKNSRNAYNQNFRGLYCSCSRPYPDAADTVPDEMIQCIMCEDWYHGRHLGEKVPDHEEFGEMICSKCMTEHPFLYTYKSHFDMEKIISVVDETEKNSDMKCESSKITVNSEPDVNGKLAEDNCVFKTMKSKVVENAKGPAFMPEGWRKELCKCSHCIALYEKDQSSYLLDENDTIMAYEERGKSRNGDESQYDKGLSALSKLDRVKQIEAIHEYNNMKVQLKDYLKTFVDAKRTVGAKDIEEFFDGMQQRKRQRIAYQIPHFCR